MAASFLRCIPGRALESSLLFFFCMRLNTVYIECHQLRHDAVICKRVFESLAMPVIITTPSESECFLSLWWNYTKLHLSIKWLVVGEGFWSTDLNGGS